MIELLARALLAGLGAALAAAPLGCFVLWRRMAFFSDAAAHAAILGVALAIALEAPPAIGVALAALAMASLLSTLEGERAGADALLGVMSHSGLALGLIAASFLGPRVDLEAYLFGDVLAANWRDVASIWVGAAAIGALIAARFSKLLLAALSPELAVAAGIDPARERFALTLALAILVAIAIQVVGALLIGALLIIPSAAARPFAASPERMVAIAASIGGASTLAGLALSFLVDTPAGPSIVAAATLAFACSTIAGRARPER